MLCRHGFAEAWNNQSVGNEKAFIKEFEVRLKDCFLQEWQSSVNNSSDRLFYGVVRNVSPFINTVKYLNILPNMSMVKVLARFVTRNHNLKVITGRWHKPIPIPFHERKCDTCNVLDDEFHFVFQCSKYDNERSTHINKYYIVRPSMFKFIELLNSTDRKVIINFCKYLKNTIMS